jgi:hypothetical protein
MAKENNLSRRRLLGVAGAASLGILGLGLSQAQARSKFKRLDKAIEAMKDAIEELEAAPKIFGGHKKQGIKLLKEGIEELRKAIEHAGG